MSHSPCPQLAQTILVSEPPMHVILGTDHISDIFLSPDTVKQQIQASQPPSASFQGLVFGWALSSE